MCEILKEISSVIGLHNCILLTRRYGGMRISIPDYKKITDTHPLSFAIGFENAVNLAKRFSNERLKIPLEVNALLDQRNREICRRFVDDRESISSLARDFGLDRTMIRKILVKFGQQKLLKERSSRVF